MNQTTYNNQNVVQSYVKQRILQKAEEILLNDVKDKLQNSIFLDIGIGGGRTTAFIAPKVKKYIGIDFSDAMIDACKASFNLKSAEFHTLDARNLSIFEDNQFDIILFSFNGIDCVDENGRINIIKEMRRVLKPSGTLLISSHNSRNLKKLYSLSIPKNPMSWYYALSRYSKIRKLNGPAEFYESKDSFILKDGAENFETDVLYMKPEIFINQMKENNFKHIKSLRYFSGETIQNKDLTYNTDPWIYYCFVKE